MRVLLDSNLPRGLAALLPGHRTDTTHQRRWSDLDDGPLLAVAAKEYDAFITMDQSIRYQQNLTGSQLRIVLVRAVRNTLPILAPLAPEVLAALQDMRPGELRIIT